MSSCERLWVAYLRLICATAASCDAKITSRKQGGLSEYKECQAAGAGSDSLQHTYGDPLVQKDTKDAPTAAVS